MPKGIGYGKDARKSQKRDDSKSKRISGKKTSSHNKPKGR